VSLIADKLEARGLLKHSVNGADRRARELYISSGQETVARVSFQSSKANDRILACLNAKEKELRVVNANKVHARPGGGRRKRGSIKTS
jgi:DNA-binding MarR family transcriptional regulator